MRPLSPNGDRYFLSNTSTERTSTFAGSQRQSTIRAMFRRRIFGEIEPPRSRRWRYFRYLCLALALLAVSFTA